MFFNKKLFKENAFDSVKKQIGTSAVTCSVNSAIGFLLICHLIKSNINNLEIEDLLSYVSSNLLQIDFLDDLFKKEIHIVSDFNVIDKSRREVFLVLSKDFYDIISSAKCNLLQAKFFYYYFTRMPILLRMTGFGNKKDIPNKTEQKEILLSCVEALEVCYPRLVNEFPHIFSNPSYYNLSRDTRKAENLTGYFKNNKDRDDFVYDYSWIFTGPLKSEEGLLPSEPNILNFNFIIESILNKYFRVFWNTFRNYYVENICFRNINY
ncbi:hypothetical protein SPSIL_014740 [Sporomusa silvacetica DSM 10669]|uniref:Uncharacterized protein n=1 Tax=Sporomusa silvacetica DSM 10669 TaxID=1123289 RepID=A0ABZ3II84_9FIRM|nr:hypothetical protein [Sporomusa silvacetica]OZC21536.1 hypothetical protein SPSIL_09470 [Sporomusa silvacetica DSM 10669]